MTDQEREQFKDMAETLKGIAEIVPDLKQIIKERQEQEIFNRKAAKIGRWLIAIAAGIGTVLGTMWAVAKLIVTLGSNT